MIKFPKINFKDNKSRGAILVFSILVMVMMISITTAILGIFLPKIRLASSPLRSVVALYAADSGLEWCLYINRAKPTPQPLPLPTIGSNNGVQVVIYYPSAGTTVATCDSATETTLDHRSVGSYQGVARSLQLSQ